MSPGPHVTAAPGLLTPSLNVKLRSPNALVTTPTARCEFHPWSLLLFSGRHRL